MSLREKMSVRRIAIFTLVLCMGLCATGVSAEQSASIGQGVLHVLGIGLTADPGQQSAPVNTGRP